MYITTQQLLQILPNAGKQPGVLYAIHQHDGFVGVIWRCFETFGFKAKGAARMPGGVAGERPVKAVPYVDACDLEVYSESWLK